ncbi:AraC family transcriptional regulator [Paenibacillus cisolokensis]|uniref:helix-turn-helix domain-containing protein n=1 Tax=Paenibacillus cisolokensis TaxID=1658519 RepID=UPI003D2A97B5
MINRPIRLTPGTLFFEERLPLFVNRVSESFSLQEHRHDFVELSYVDEGSGFHYVNGDVLPVAKSDLFILPIGVSHVFRPADAGANRSLVVYNCLFKPEPLAADLRDFPGTDGLRETLAALQLLPGDAGSWRRIRDRDGRLGEWFRAMHLEYERRAPGRVALLYAKFVELIVLLERAHTAGPGTETAAQERDSLAGIVRRIERRFAEPLHAGRLAEELNMSERHFHRLFKRYTGSTFNAYVQNRRIDKSCELLASTRMPVQDVGPAVGYQDKSFFLQLFKRKTGMTPREYRRLKNNEAADAGQPKADAEPKTDTEPKADTEPKSDAGQPKEVSP